MAHRSLRVGDLVGLVRRGALVLPDPDRPFDWQRQHVVTLVESLYRRRPTGSVVLWETARPLRGVGGAATSPQGVVRRVSAAIARRISGGRSVSTRVVLDGQKRLAGLYRMMTLDPALRIRFHVESEAFALESGAMRGDPRWIDAAAVLGSETGAARALWQVQRGLNLGMSDPRTGRYQVALKRLAAVRDHAFPVEILASDHFDDVSETIARINPHGAARHDTEIALARLAFPWPEPVLDDFTEALHDLEQRHFTLTALLLMRALAAVSQGTTDLDDTRWIEATPTEEVARNWHSTRDAMMRTVGFLEELGFDSSGMISHPAILVPLTVLFARRQALTASEQAAARYWFLRAMALERYARAAEHAIARDLYALAGDRPAWGLLRVLETQVPAQIIVAEDLVDTGPGTALYALAYLAVRERGAVDWVTGQPLSEAEPAGRRRIAASHIFPPSALREMGVSGSQINEIANIVFAARPGLRTEHTALPEEYLPEVVTKLGPEALTAQFVPVGRELWAMSRFQDFLGARRELIAHGLEAMLAAARPSDLPVGLGGGSEARR